MVRCSMRRLVFEFVVEFDREGDQNLRQQGR